MRALVLLVAIPSCVSPETAVLRLRFEQEEREGDVDGIAGLWDIDALAVRDGDGSITLRPNFERESDDICGYTDDKSGCTPTVFGCQFCNRYPIDEDIRPLCLAHEVGHVAHLGHSSEPDNLMHFAIGRDTTETTEDQRQAVRERAAWLELCP